MEYTEIRCIIKNWHKYSQVHFLMPNIPWSEMTSDNYKGTHAYWSIISKDLLWKWENSPSLKPFTRLISTQAFAGVYIVILDGVVDRLVEMEDYIVSGKEIMTPLSNKYAVLIEKGELRQLYYIGSCENYWDMNICKLIVGDFSWNFTILQKTSLFNSGMSQYAEIMDDPIGKEIWDKMRKWVCFDLINDPSSKPPYILKTTQRELYSWIENTTGGYECPEEVLTMLEKIQVGECVSLADFRAQFGLDTTESDTD